jgi:C-terminal processing protease CtpA/Prc
MEASRELEKAFRTFKQEQVEEIVLDLRYNGGGYTITGAVLASMLVPVKEVVDGSVFNLDVYNKTLTEAYEKKDEELSTRFADEFTISSSSTQSSYTVHPLQVNPEIRKLWVITTGNTASASEALICGLKPYMDVSLVGEKTYGKFCGGYLIEAEDFYESLSKQKGNEVDCDDAIAKLEGWGIYVIASRYSDKDGVTLSMPEGIQADYEAKDNPMDGFQLGDPSETMLSAVLELSAGKRTKASVAAPIGLAPAPPVRRPGYGVLLH